MNKVNRKKPILNRIQYARSLAVGLGAENRYSWDPNYWSSTQLEELIRGLERRLMIG